MKTPEEIKLDIQECCEEIADHGLALWCDGEFTTHVLGNALALIRELEARVVDKEAENRAMLSTITMQERVRADLEVRISQLEAKSPRWISVEERQPTPEEARRCHTVRVLWGDRPGCYMEFDAFYSLINDEWSTFTQPFGYEALPVTYWLWMPEIAEPEEG